MRTLLFILVLGLCLNNYAQQDKNADATLPLAVDLKYQNDKNSFSKATTLNPDLNSQIIAVRNVDTLPKNSLYIDSKRIKFSLLQPIDIDLSKELNKIMHRFPGDGRNPSFDARGYRH